MTLHRIYKVHKFHKDYEIYKVNKVYKVYIVRRAASSAGRHRPQAGIVPRLFCFCVFHFLKSQKEHFRGKTHTQTYSDLGLGTTKIVMNSTRGF